MSASPRRPGRPPLDDANPSVPVTLRLPSRVYEDVYQRAQREGVSIPEVIRRDVQQAAATRTKP